jgi:hypothetical protein
MGLKALGQFYLRHHNAIQTVGLLALLTVEVGVHIIIVIVVMTMAELKTLTIHSAINHMHRMVLTESCSVRKMPDLSIVSIRFCSSAMDCGSIEASSAFTTVIRLAVGLMPCSKSSCS